MIQIQKATFQNTTKEEICRAHRLLVHAYAVTEIEIWGENYVRLSYEEFEELIELGQLFTARIDGILVGSISVYNITANVYGFGLLSADFSYKGKGIGRALIDAAEKEAVRLGGTTMELEILKPRDIVVPVKVSLHEWYQRLGYEFLETVDFVDRKPDKAEKALKFIVPSVFDCYRKSL